MRTGLADDARQAVPLSAVPHVRQQMDRRHIRQQNTPIKENMFPQMYGKKHHQQSQLMAEIPLPSVSVYRKNARDTR